MKTSLKLLRDIIKYYNKLLAGYDCVFGTRFCKEAKLVGYPPHKLIVNRLCNWFVMVLFRLPYNDLSNAFKCYNRRSIDGMKPLLSSHFNLTVEMPLKAIVRGYSWCVVSTNWYGRKKGFSKMKIAEIGSRYMSTIFYIWFENLIHETRG